jgi:hypothetical protein
MAALAMRHPTVTAIIPSLAVPHAGSEVGLSADTYANPG